MRSRIVARSRIPGSRALASNAILVLALTALGIQPVGAQANLPDNRIHVSVTLGGYFLLGVGYTHWIEQHHALEFTVFPFAHPGEGFPFALRAGYAWVPSGEIWRAKLGGNATVLISPASSGRDRFTPLLTFTPGIQYDPTGHQSFRADLWMSYYLTEKAFAPTAIEFLSAWKM